MSLKPFRYIPRDVAEWTRWMLQQDVVSSGDITVTTTESTTTTTSGSSVNDQSLAYFLEY